jgi:hypothetical protein
MGLIKRPVSRVTVRKALYNVHTLYIKALTTQPIKSGLFRGLYESVHTTTPPPKTWFKACALESSRRGFKSWPCRFVPVCVNLTRDASSAPSPSLPGRSKHYNIVTVCPSKATCAVQHFKHC